MLKFLIILITIYIFIKFGKILLSWYVRTKLNNPRRDVKPPVSEKFKNADEADFTDIIDPEKKKK